MGAFPATEAVYLMPDESEDTGWGRVNPRRRAHRNGGCFLEGQQKIPDTPRNYPEEGESERGRAAMAAFPNQANESYKQAQKNILVRGAHHHGRFPKSSWWTGKRGIDNEEPTDRDLKRRRTAMAAFPDQVRYAMGRKVGCGEPKFEDVKGGRTAMAAFPNYERMKQVKVWSKHRGVPPWPLSFQDLKIVKKCSTPTEAMKEHLSRRTRSPFQRSMHQKDCSIIRVGQRM